MLKLSKIIDDSNIFIISATDKNEALNFLIDKASKQSCVIDKSLFRKELIGRENILSTGIGLGIAIPHVKSRAVSELTLVLGVSKKGIEFKAIDDKKVNFVFLVGVPEDENTLYLQIISRIILAMKNLDFQKKLLACNSSLEIKELFDKLKK